MYWSAVYSMYKGTYACNSDYDKGGHQPFESDHLLFKVCRCEFQLFTSIWMDCIIRDLHENVLLFIWRGNVDTVQ